MSRWNEQSKNHPFQASWSALKAGLLAVEVGESLSDDEFQELARLRKVITYVGSVLDATDPELIPLSKWDELNPQVVACANEIVAYTTNPDVAYLRQANGYADSILSLARPIVPASGKSARALSEAAREHSETLEKFFSIYKKNASDALQVVRENRDEVAGIAKNTEELANEVRAARNEIVGANGAEGTHAEIKEILADIEDSHEKISGLYNDLLIGDEGQDSKKSKVEAAAKSIAGEADRIKALVDRATETVKGIESFYEKSLGALGEDGKRTGGYSSDLEGLKKNLIEFEDQQKVKYRALNLQIENLLPGATSVGLASAYRDMKDSFAMPIKFAGGAFYVSIAVLILGSILMAVDSATIDDGLKFKELGDWQSVLRSLVYKLPFYGPAVWVAYYASKRRSEYQRLQQEYAHKEALAKSYDSYKKQIKELDLEDDEMLVALLNKAIDAIAHNASQTLDGKHGDKMPLQEAIDRIAEVLTKKGGLILRRLPFFTRLTAQGHTELIDNVFSQGRRSI